MGTVWLDTTNVAWDERMPKWKGENLKMKFHLLYFVLGPTIEKPHTLDVSIIFVVNPESSLFH